MTQEQFLKTLDVFLQIQEGSAPTLHGHPLDAIELDDGQVVGVEWAADHPELVDWGVTTAWVHFADRPGRENTLISERELAAIQLQESMR